MKAQDKTLVVTTTYYNPDVESDVFRSNLAKRGIKSATDLGYKVIIVDNGSSNEFLKYIENCGAILHQETKLSMGQQRRKVIQIATQSGGEIIAFTEPEKIDYISKIALTASPIIEGLKDLIIPRRKSLRSYPKEQQYAEAVGNLLWKNLTGYDLDIWFGPRTWRKDVSRYFLGYDGSYGDKWESINIIPLLEAIVGEVRIGEINIDYTHPIEQTQYEECNQTYLLKRIEQLHYLTRIMKEHWKRINTK